MKQSHRFKKKPKYLKRGKKERKTREICCAYVYNVETAVVVHWSTTSLNSSKYLSRLHGHPSEASKSTNLSVSIKSFYPRKKKRKRKESCIAPSSFLPLLLINSKFQNSRPVLSQICSLSLFLFLSRSPKHAPENTHSSQATEIWFLCW